MKQTIYLDTSIVSAYYDARNPERQKLTREFWAKLKGYQVLTRKGSCLSSWKGRRSCL